MFICVSCLSFVFFFPPSPRLSFVGLSGKTKDAPRSQENNLQSCELGGLGGMFMYGAQFVRFRELGVGVSWLPTIQEVLDLILESHTHTHTPQNKSEKLGIG